MDELQTGKAEPLGGQWNPEDAMSFYEKKLERRRMELQRLGQENKELRSTLKNIIGLINSRQAKAFTEKESWQRAQLQAIRVMCRLMLGHL